MNFSVETKFLSALMHNIESLTTLEKEVSVNDFRDRVFYDIYVKIVDFLIEGHKSSYPDLRFQFKDDEVALDIIHTMEKEEIVLNLKSVYQEMVALSQRERISALARNILTDCKGDTSTRDILINTESTLLSINSTSNISVRSFSDSVDDYLEKLDERIIKFRESNGDVESIVDHPTGLEALDKRTLGMQSKTSWLVAAGTSDGKTQLAVQMCDNIVRKKEEAVLYFMLEDSGANLMERAVSLRTGVDIEKIRIGNLSDYNRDIVIQTFMNIKQEKRWFVEENLVDINDIMAKAKFAKLKHPEISVVVLDNINLAYDKTHQGNREQEISNISKKMIELAKTCDVCSLILQQLNTNVDERHSGMPVRMNDLRDSKAPGHDASVTLFLHFPFKYAEDANFSKEFAQLIIGKNRYGEANKIIKLTNYAKICKFSEGVPSIAYDMANRKGKKNEKT